MTIASEPQLFLNLDAIAAHAVELRHELHRYPEVGYQEVITAGLLQKELTRLGIPFQKGLAGGTGTLATIEGLKGESDRVVALRSDIDALPITELTGLPYASTRAGFMHACGHDGHMAILLGAAAVLWEQREQFSGTVKLLFQPAEEGGLGASKMVADGALNGVEAIFGLHGWPTMKVGQVGTRAGALLASVDGFKVLVKGRGGHAAAPHQAIDPIACAAAMIQAWQTIVSRETDPTDAVVLTISQFNAGTAFNVIPDVAELQGTLRTLADARRKGALESLERIGRGVASAYGCEVSFSYFSETPPTVNPPEMAMFVQETAVAALGAASFSWMPKPAMWGEDFAFYLQKIPGCFFALGVQPQDRSEYPSLHNPHFDFTDAAIPYGVRIMVNAVVRFLKSEV